MKHPTHHIFEFTPESLGAWCESRRMPKFRGKQVLEWVYEKGVIDPGAMTNLSKLDQTTLAKDMTFLSGRTLRRQAASDGTQKLLIEWDDHQTPQPVRGLDITPPPALAIAGQEQGDPSRQTECVMIPSLANEREPEDDDGSRRAPRFTACISSQVGCPVGCRFCASGLTGLDANLSAGRIVEQVWRLARLQGVRRITNVVFMGMGEPLSNLGAVIPAVKTITSLWGPGISARKVTISTVGLPKAIQRLAEQLDLPVTLALSLHAPNDELRRKLIPWAEYTTIAELLGACRAWFERTGREITLEYTLLRGVNDRPEHARQLAELARTLRANVNLIRYNEVAGTEFERPRDEDVLAFQKVLRGANINVHIRASRGRDIAAACGQLRHENTTKAAPSTSTP
ncbi:MAG: 23S rRNA (adenine(2503)-C(2))-methyltransferase RlmN [Leptolyngbya sp. PLA1]|nr:23S rRNA (adenine(2503)-C(2))-methyltransferase RlmN [Leptolyngbya sp. PLA1]